MEHLGRNDPRLGREEAQSKRALPCADYPDTGPAGTAKTMTTEESLKRHLDRELAEAWRERFFRATTPQHNWRAALLRDRRAATGGRRSHQFHLGARAGKRGPPPRDHREDMYGNRILSPEGEGQGRGGGGKEAAGGVCQSSAASSVVLVRAHQQPLSDSVTP